LLHADRCNARVATPSDTVNDNEFILFALLVQPYASPIHDDFI
jgi:hypothetical protein